MELNKCLGCMEDFRGYPCPKCGFDIGQVKKNAFSLPPQTILCGKYLVGKVLGQGGFGITYIGWDIALERKVAIKEYYPSGQVSRLPGTRGLVWSESEQARLAQQDGMEMFLKEARKMAKVEDIPGVVKVRELFRENETAYIVMDFVEGETLKARLKRTGPMPWAQAKAIFRPAIQAMEKVHQAGLIHRDLSPDNIMLTPNGQVKILDLGAAKDLNVNSGASSMQVAKSGFSPFEQYTQRGGSGPWTDVYTMAATIYFTLTGKLPPAAMDRIEEDTISWNLPGLDALPASALSALQKALAVTAKKRTQSMEELEKGLFDEAPQPKSEPKSASEPEPKTQPKSEPKSQSKKTPKKIVWAAVAAAAVVLCGVVYGTVVKPANDYKEAQTLLDAGNYEEAEAAFAALGDYRDSAEQVQEAQKAAAYQQAQSLIDSGQFDEAISTLKTLGDYRDSPEQLRLISTYQQADKLMKIGQYPGAAIAFSKLGDYQDSAKRAESARRMRQVNSISAEFEHTVGLRSDGTVVAVGWNKYGQCDVTDWSDIVAVAAGDDYTVGLRSDGTVVTRGFNVSGRCDVSDWSDIVAVSAGYSHTVGLRSNGTVVAAGVNTFGKCDVSGWSDIVAVAAGIGHTVGLRRDGTVVAVGDNDDGQCDVSGWSDIVAVSAGWNHTVGLRSDGTVVAVGYNKDGQCDVGGWSDIVAIAAGNWHTVGLRSDGTVVAVGYSYHGRCDVDDWKGILTP